MCGLVCCVSARSVCVCRVRRVFALRACVRVCVLVCVCVVEERNEGEGGGAQCSLPSPFFFWVVLRRCPTLPHPPRCSTIGAVGLSFQVRNGFWAFPPRYDHRKVFHTPPPPGLIGGGCGLSVIRIVVASSAFSFHPLFWLGVWVVFSVGPLVPVGSRAHYCASTSGLSTQSSPGGLHTPQVGCRKPHLGAGFPLRCFQRLSLPNVANQPCTWRYNWHTRGSSIPVLSY